MLTWRLRAAKLKGACVEDIDYRAARGLDKSMVRGLAQQSTWVAQHESIFVLGPTGVGKSFIVGFVFARRRAVSRPDEGARRWQPAALTRTP